MMVVLSPKGLVYIKAVKKFIYLLWIKFILGLHFVSNSLLYITMYPKTKENKI